MTFNAQVTIAGRVADVTYSPGKLTGHPVAVRHIQTWITILEENKEPIGTGNHRPSGPYIEDEKAVYAAMRLAFADYSYTLTGDVPVGGY